MEGFLGTILHLKSPINNYKSYGGGRILGTKGKQIQQYKSSELLNIKERGLKEENSF